MLTELERAVYSFTALERVYSLRYDMSALLALEKRGLSWRDVFAPSITGEAICEFLTAGGTERSAALQLVKADARGAWGQCKRAMLLALPVRDPDVLDVQRPADGGPAPEDRPHEYELQLFALSEQLPLRQGFYYNEFLRAIRGKVLDSAVIRGVYPN